MIAKLRRRHLAFWLVLAVVLPVLYVIALSVRPDEPVVPQLPSFEADLRFGVDTESGLRSAWVWEARS